MVDQRGDLWERASRPETCLRSLWYDGVIAYSTRQLTNVPGSIARISPHMVVTSDLNLYRKANAHRINDYSRGPWYKAFKMDAERENLFTELNDEKHSLMRAKLSPGVSTHVFLREIKA